MAALELTRAQVLAFRRTVGALDRRLGWGEGSLRIAARAGLQDSMPRAALLSLHARVAGTPRNALDAPSLTQVWGPRFSVFVVTDEDAPIFTLGRMPDAGPRVERAEETTARLVDLLGDDRMTYAEAGRALGVHPNSLRYGTLTGRIRVRWEGAGQPTIWVVPEPVIDRAEARRELARRYLHVFGPGTSDGFADWAGITAAAAAQIVADVGTETIPVATPLGPSIALAADEEALRGGGSEPAPARLLPSGDAFYLLWGEYRSLVVEDADRRDELWTSRVWPGAVIVAGEVAGVWRRSKGTVTVEPWRRLTKAEQSAIEAEATTMPLPESDGEITVRWAL